MFKFVMESVKDNYDEKIKSPFWGSMIITWLTWNWEVWYTTIFISESLTGNKVIYIKEMYNYIDFYNLFPCLGIIFHWILMPLLLSWFIIIFVTPKISHWFLGKHDENKIKENEKLASRIKSETKVLEAEEQKIKKEQKIEKIKEKSEEEKWDEEYIKIVKQQAHLLSELSTFIYDYHGFFKIDYQVGGKWHNGYPGEKVIPIGHAFELIAMDKDIDSKFVLTKKGKYFLKKHAFEG